MNILIKSLMIIAAVQTAGQSLQAMNNNENVRNFQEYFLAKKRHEYCINLLFEHYKEHDLLSESALSALKNLSPDAFKNLISTKISPEAFDTFIKYVKTYYNKVEKKRIGLRDKDKELHATALNKLIPAFKGLESEKKSEETKDSSLLTEDEKFEKSVIEHLYDNDSTNNNENDTNEFKITIPLRLIQKKNIQKQPTSPSIRIVKKNIEYSPQEKNYVPSLAIEKGSEDKELPNFKIVFENKKRFKNPFINLEQQEKIERLSKEDLETLKSDITNTANLIRKNSFHDDKENLSCNPYSKLRGITRSKSFEKNKKSSENLRKKSSDNILDDFNESSENSKKSSDISKKSSENSKKSSENRDAFEKWSPFDDN